MINQKLISLSALTLLTLPLLTPIARADAKGETILRAAFKKLGESKSMTATLVQIIESKALRTPVQLQGTLAAMKPNYLAIRLTAPLPDGQAGGSVYAATGKEYFTYVYPNDEGTNTYHVEQDKANPTEFAGVWEAEVDAFFGGEKLLEKGTPEFSKVEKVGKISYDVVLMKMKPVGGNPVRTLTYYVGQKDKLIHRASYDTLITGNISGIQTNVLTDINLNAEKKPSDFAYTPPKESRKFVLKKKREVIFAHYRP